MKKIITILILLFVALISNAQNNVYKYAYTKEVTISKNNQLLTDPWSGGFNNPQFQSLDVNFDCYDDLIIFERDGQEVRVYLNDTSSSSGTYSYAPEYSRFFPSDISDLLIIKDYDMDGKPDLFTSNSPFHNNGNGLKVYKNISDTVLKFELITSHLNAWNGTNISTVFVRPFDIPSIEDIDGDGDLDIVAQDQVALSYQYYENRSSSPDSFDLHYNERCWGHFYQWYDGVVNFNYDCFYDFDRSAQRDGGYSLLTIDLNADGLKDALIGDPDRSNLTMLINGGSINEAEMTQVNYQYPKPTADSVKVTSFPAAFYLDVNNNGRSDLIVAPNQLFGSRDTGSIWFYDNFGAENLPNFQLAQKDFLTEHQIDVGTMAIPVFADISGDNVPDLLIGNVGYFKSYDPSLFQVTYTSQISYYKNVGTPANPKFEFITDDLAGLSSRKLVRISPSFTDIDGDGDNDLLFGESNGTINYYKNIAPIGSEASFVFQTDSFMNVNFGVNPSPFFFDINKDNSLDLLVGQKNGNIKLYINQGNVNSALFDTAITDTLGGIFNYIPGYDNHAIPYIGKINGDTNNILITGGTFGELYFYSGLDGNYLSNFTMIDSIKVANGPIAPALANLNTSDSLELVIGQRSGGLLLFNLDQDQYNFSPYPRDTCGHGEPTGINTINSLSPGFEIYPNPNNGNFKVRFDTRIPGFGSLSIINVTGKVVYQKAINEIEANQEIELNQSALQQGMYIVSISINGSYFRKKLIIQ